MISRERLLDEVKSYWVIRRRALRAIPLAGSALAFIISCLIVLVLISPIAYFNGPIITGAVYFMYYELYVRGSSARYPFLDSAINASRVAFVYAIVVAITGAISAIKLRRGQRAWASFSVVSSLAAALLILLLFSILRLFIYDAIPVIQYTVVIPLTGGVLYPSPPDVSYAWPRALAAYPIFFFLLYFALISFSVITAIILLYKPAPLIRKIKPGALDKYKRSRGDSVVSQ